ncbi:hypothetical protein WR25_19785 [Diploscapter pachys]|uniref:Uncharacterized protein n=1 Tax=Diploscapter pachys TaxID=2018661 RepID=A0A2A2M517_9BILA|nr:hypothetical protein WR25_19785 [Diploscapter pachys]
MGERAPAPHLPTVGSSSPFAEGALRLRREQVGLSQRVDRLELAAGFMLPEGPAIAGGGALERCAELVDRAAGAAVRQQAAVGADRHAEAALGVGEDRAGGSAAAMRSSAAAM